MSKNANITWTPSVTPNVEGYNVYLNKDGAGYIRQNTELIAGSEYTIEDLADGSYELYVTAFKNGLESEPSEVVEFEVIDIPNMDGIQLWLDADSIDLEDEVEITTWENSAKDNYHAVSVGTKPILRHSVINGKKVVDFTSAQGMSLESSTLGSTGLFADENEQFSVYTVSRIPIGNIGYTIAKADGGVVNSDFVFSLGRINQNQRLHDRQVNIRSGWHTYGGSLQQDDYVIEKVTHDGTTTKYLLPTLYEDVDVSAGTRPDLVSEPIIIGGRTGGTAFTLNGYIAEIIIFDRALSDSEDNLIRTYLGKKYNISYE